MLKQLRNFKQKVRFYLEQDLAIKKPFDEFSISKGSFRKHLPSNPVIVDCGSHNGQDSIDLCKIFPKAIIHCFEPIPEIYKQLKKNTERYNNIFCYQLALADRDGKAEMFVSSEGSDGSSSLLEPLSHLHDHPNVLFSKIIEVNIIKLDTWAKTHSIPKVDLLWLDMQGFEFQMLHASPTILRSIKLIHTEVSTKETYKEVLVYDKFKHWLESKHFEVLKEAIPKGSDMGNVLFKRIAND